MSAYLDYLKQLTQTIAEAEKDARSLSEFIYKPVGFKVNRRLAPQIYTLDYYIQFLEAFKSVFTHESGYVQVGNKTVPTIGQALADAMLSAGYEIVDSFESGATIEKRNQVLRSSATGKLYKWGGDLPKVVELGATPETSGGYGDLAWLEVSDAALRQDLLGSITSGKGAALVNGAVLKVSDKDELKSFNPLAGTVITVSGSYGGVFELDAGDLSEAVAGDINGDFYIPPITDNSGGSGAWVRVSGVPLTNSFAVPAPNNARLLSSIDNREYIHINGEWLALDELLDLKIDNHIQDPNAHGLKGSSVAIGIGSEASGSFPVVVGANSSAQSAYTLGRENNITSSVFSIALGRSNTVSNTSDKRQNIAVGTNNNLSDVSLSVSIGSNANQTSTTYSALLGSSLNATNSTTFVGIGRNIQASDCVESFAIGSNLFLNNTRDTYVLGKSLTEPSATRYCSESIVLGHRCFIAGSESNPVNKAAVLGSQSYVSGSGSNSVVIGHNSHCNHANSVVIGNNITTTASNEVVIGGATDSTSIAGNLNVTGTKNFKIPHPVPSKADDYWLVHSSYEGDCEGGTIYRHQVATTDGTATKDLPEWFKYLNKDVVVYVTPHKHFGAAYGEVDGNTLTITSNEDGEYNVLIMGTRNDVSVQNWEGVEVLR